MSNSKLTTILLGMLVCKIMKGENVDITVKQFENQADYALHLDSVCLRYLECNEHKHSFDLNLNFLISIENVIFRGCSDFDTFSFFHLL